MSVKLIVIDMDETLLRDDKTYDKTRFNQAVKEFAKKDIRVMIATGNPLPTLESHIDDEIIDTIYLAAENGNQITQDNDPLKIKTFSGELMLKLEEADFMTEDIEFMCSTGYNQYAKQIDPENKEAVEVFFKALQETDSFHPLPDGNEPVKAEMYTPFSVEENKEIAKTINETFDELEAAVSSVGWIDIYHKSGGKDYAVKYLQEKYDISVEETMAFGDSLNDEPMMPYAAYSVAMANADDELKEICNYEIGTNEEQAVIDVLEQYLEKNHLEFLNKI